MEEGQAQAQVQAQHDGRGPSTTLHEGQPQDRLGPQGRLEPQGRL